MSEGNSRSFFKSELTRAHSILHARSRAYSPEKVRDADYHQGQKMSNTRGECLRSSLQLR